MAYKHAEMIIQIVKCKTLQWLKSERLKAETEAFIMATLDQNLLTRNYKV